MKIYFRCELLTDVVLNQRAATEGNQESLDFIPGNNFLGIVAGKLYDELKPEENLLLFHSGKIRFGDAHPEQLKLEKNEKGKNELKPTGKRSLRIPASFYKSKLSKLEDGLYISHEVTNPEEKTYKDFHPKQCRTGFYIFENELFEEVRTEKSFAIKSAYDSEKRRSKDEMMYGYESLAAGSFWLFEVAIDDDVDSQLIEKIKSSLVIGEKRIGRSRTAQYGLVKISEVKKDSEEIPASIRMRGSDILIYTEARLIFLDEYGLPTFQPTAEQLGIREGEIDWSRTQVRTFQYAPWNFKRQCRDADRCGIEKGSVFVIKDGVLKEKSNEFWVGSYQNEGFGKVIVNPDFLQVEPNSNGKAKYKFVENNQKPAPSETSSNDPLFKFLTQQQEKEKNEQNIVRKVNKFVEDYEGKFKSDSFASQWGTIRSTAMQHKKKQEITNALFEDQEGYLVHGVAAEKWSEKGRYNALKKFVEEDLRDLSDKDFQSALINLSAEMAKISKK